jgi:hypothetical protein
MAIHRTLMVDRVLEVANAPGTGNVTLGGAVPGYRTFSSVPYPTTMAAGDTCAYFIEAVDVNGTPTGLWERGYGTFNSATSFSRSTIMDGSSGFSLVNFTTSVRIGISPMTETTASFPQPGGRLTAVINAPVSDTATTGSTTIWYTPYLHDRIILWYINGLRVVQFVQTNMDISTLAVGGYDVFASCGGGGNLTLSYLAWTNNTARVALAFSNGFLCRGNDPGSRYLGSFYVPNTGFTYDTPNGSAVSVGGKRFVWNYYNRVARNIYVYDNTATWSYNVAGWRICRGVAAPNNCIEVFRGANEDPICAQFTISGQMPQSQGFFASIGVNSAVPTVPATTPYNYNANAGTSTGAGTAAVSASPPMGYAYLCMAEYELGQGTPGVTFGGNMGSAIMSGTTMT